MKNTFINIRFLLLSCFLIFSGCSSVASTKNMIPVFEKNQFSPIHKSIKISNVETVATKASGDCLLNIDNCVSQLELEQFKDALIASIANCGIFQNVVLQGQADYELSAKTLFIGQRQNNNSDVISKARIVYTLGDSETQKIIWQDEIKSLEKVSMDEAYVGSKRFNGSLEKAIQTNLNQLVKKISSMDL